MIDKMINNLMIKNLEEYPKRSVSEWKLNGTRMYFPPKPADAERFSEIRQLVILAMCRTTGWFTLEELARCDNELWTKVLLQDLHSVVTELISFGILEFSTRDIFISGLWRRVPVFRYSS